MQFNRKLKHMRARLGAALALAGLAALPASAQNLEKMEVSAVRVSSIGSLLIAQDRGFFKDQGIDVHVNLSDSGQSSVLAVASGSADVAAGALNASIYNLAAKGGVKIIAGQTYANATSHSGGLIVPNAMWDAGFKTVKDMKGKRIAVTAAGSAPQYELGEMAALNGFTINDLTLVILQSNSNILAAFKGGQIDGAIGAIPIPEQVVAEHIGHLVAWASDLTDFEEGAVYANSKILASKPDLVKRYLAAYTKGCAEYDAAFSKLDKDGNQIKGPNYDAYAKLISDTLGVAPEKMAGSYAYCEPGLKIDMADLGRQLKFWKSIGAVDKSIELDKVVQPMVQ